MYGITGGSCFERIARYSLNEDSIEVSPSNSSKLSNNFLGTFAFVNFNLVIAELFKPLTTATKQLKLPSSLKAFKIKNN